MLHVHVSCDETTKIGGLQVLSDYIFYKLDILYSVIHNNSSYNIIILSLVNSVLYNCNSKVCQFMFPYKVIFTNTNFF